LFLSNKWLIVYVCLYQDMTIIMMGGLASFLLIKKNKLKTQGK